MQDLDIYDLPVEEAADDNISAVHPNNINFRNNYVLNNHNENLDNDMFNDELNQELEVLNNNANVDTSAKVLKGVYRDGENFIEDVCT